MPSLEDFIESLTQEKTKLINMGTIKGLRAHALTIHDGSHKYHKSKYKDKRKAHAHPKKEGYTKPFTDASRSKGLLLIMHVIKHFVKQTSSKKKIV